jgi:signal transduction histidine kinase
MSGKNKKINSVNNALADEISEFAENLIDTIREPLIALDKDLRVVKASRSFYDFFRVNPGATIGTLIYDLGNGQWNIPKLRELLETILPEKTTFDNYEVEHDFSAIGKRIMLLNARKIQRGLGKEQTILLAFEDITERKKIETGLEKTRKKLAAIKNSDDEVSEFAENLIDTIREPLIALDKDLRVVKATRSFYDFFRVSPSQTIGTLIYDLGNGQWNIPRLRELLETILPERTTFDNYEVEHDFSTIGKRIMHLNARKIQRGLGKEQIILLAIEDITERKQAEDVINLMNDQLVVLNSEKNKFFSIIAHDLKGPFQGFLGLTQTLAEDATNYSKEELTQLGWEMNKTASKLFILLKNLLDWAQMQKGSMSFQPAEISLHNLIANNVEAIKWRSDQKAITVNNMVTGILHVFGDNNMINSVLMNLISNAVKFTPRNGTITLKANKTSKHIVEITVSDTGVGIRNNVIEKLFKLGEKTGTEGTEGEQSTGLGLLLCKEFVEKNGGRIWVESEEGKGSTFYFTLPSHER